MEKKVGIILLIGSIISIIIFFMFRNNTKDLLAIGDSLASGYSSYNIKTTSFNDLLKENMQEIDNYNNDFAFNNLSSRDLLDLLISNHKINDSSKTIKQLIASSEIITIALGSDELSNNQNINLYLYYMDASLKIIRGISKDEIYLIGLYSDYDKINDVNDSLKDLCLKYDINYIDTELLKDDEYKYDNSRYINVIGHEQIYKILQKTIDRS